MNEWDSEKEIIVFEVSFVTIRKYAENSQDEYNTIGISYQNTQKFTRYKSL